MTAEEASTAQTSTAPASTPAPAPAAAPPASTETAAHATGDGEPKAPPQQATTLPKGDSKGAIDSKEPSEDPGKTRHARAYAKATGKWPKDYAPTDADLKATGKPSPSDAEQPGNKKRSPDGGGKAGTSPAAPGSASPSREGPDHASSLREQYAQAGDEEGVKLHAADAELRRNGYEDEDLVGLTPARRVHLAASSLKRVEGFRRALGSQNAPSDTAKRPDAAGRQTSAAPSAKPSNANPGHISPELAEQMRDSYVFLEGPARDAANAALDAMLANQARGPSAKPSGTQTEQGEDRGTERALTEEETDLAAGNLEYAQLTVAKTYPWITDPATFARVVKHAERLCKADGEDSTKVLLRGRTLTKYIEDAAAMVQTKETRQSKNAAAQQAAQTSANGANLSGPKPSGAVQRTRELTPQERSQTALRAAKDSKGDPEQNKKLLKQYREELTGATL